MQVHPLSDLTVTCNLFTKFQFISQNINSPGTILFKVMAPGLFLIKKLSHLVGDIEQLGEWP